MFTKDMTVVYVVREGEINPELRYSLRTVERNLPCKNVVIAGYKPKWVSDEVQYIKVEQTGNKHENAARNLFAACRSDLVTEDFILMNDDFFILNPTQFMPALHRGFLADVVHEFMAYDPSNEYIPGSVKTFNILKSGIENPLSYELHVPMQMNKQWFVKNEEVFDNHMKKDEYLDLRTMYGNFNEVGGMPIKDVKITSMTMPWRKEWPFLSTSDEIFFKHGAGTYIMNQYQEVSKYEK